MEFSQILDLAIVLQTAETPDEFDQALAGVSALSEADQEVYRKFEIKIAVARALHWQDDASFADWLSVYRANVLREYMANSG